MKTTSAAVCIRCSKPTSGGIYIVDGTSTRGPYCPTCAQIVIFQRNVPVNGRGIGDIL